MELIPLAATALVLLPILGSHPVVARFIANPPTSRFVIYPMALVASIALLLWGLGIIQPWIAIVLSAPLYQATITRMLYRHFVIKHSREPVDAAFNFDCGITVDRSFAAGNILLGLFIPMAIFMWSVWGSGVHQ